MPLSQQLPALSVRPSHPEFAATFPWLKPTLFDRQRLPVQSHRLRDRACEYWRLLTPAEQSEHRQHSLEIPPDQSGRTSAAARPFHPTRSERRCARHCWSFLRPSTAVALLVFVACQRARSKSGSSLLRLSAARPQSGHRLSHLEFRQGSLWRLATIRHLYRQQFSAVRAGRRHHQLEPMHRQPTIEPPAVLAQQLSEQPSAQLSQGDPPWLARSEQLDPLLPTSFLQQGRYRYHDPEIRELSQVPIGTYCDRPI